MNSILAEAVCAVVKEARPAISSMPADCTNECGMGPCNCSGVYRVVGWSIDVPRLRELLTEVGYE